jgi:hypothetical protein
VVFVSVSGVGFSEGFFGFFTAGLDARGGTGMIFGQVGELDTPLSLRMVFCE